MTMYLDTRSMQRPLDDRGQLRIRLEASDHVLRSESIEEQDRVQPNGIQPLDALHLASAIDAGVDYFCTCDDAFFKAKRQETGVTIIVDPIELAEHIDQWPSRRDR